MARRVKAKKLKYQKMETRVNLKWTTGENTSSPFSDSVYIDVAQVLSQQNRKLIRQGQMFRIKGFRAYTNDVTPVKQMMKVGRAYMSWPTFNAYRKGRALWHKHNALATENLSPAVYPKYHDFKVFMNHSHYDNVINSGDANLLPVDFDDNALSAGEWVYSKFHDSGSTSDEYYCHLNGAHGGSTGSWTSVGLVQAYAESRPVPQVDATTSDDFNQVGSMTSPWGRLFNDDDQSTDVYDDLLADNDSPPYSRVDYPGGASSGQEGQSVFYGRLPSINQPDGTTGRVPTFDAPCGLIRFEVDAEESMSNSAIHIEFDVEILGEM